MLDHQELLEETVASLDNLPAEVRHIFNELRTRSEDYYEIRANIAHKDVELKKLIKNGPIEPPPPADSVPAGTTGTNNENNKSKEDQPEGVGAPLPSTDKPAIAPDGNTPLAPSTSTQANSIDNAANETTASTTAAVVAAPGAASDLTTPQQPQPSPNSTTGLDWKTGAEAVEDFPEQKEAFWKIVQMFGDCGRIADEKIALVDRAKTVLDRHIKRITASLEANGVLLPNTSSSSTAATPLPVPQHVPLSSSSSSLSSSLAHSSSTLHQSIPPPPNVRSTSQAFLFSTPLNPQAPKFLSQRTPSSSTDILNKASEMAAAVVAESNSKLSSLGAGISGIGNSGSNSLAHDGGKFRCQD
ncbi:hypothetical protein BDR26DRAFT_860976 [Obelidium mucronatum]|nr:hypothetical protein BDR26DRAFT_860976 [Obelidium mucronatum]